MSTFGIIGPFFFEENGGAVTINAERYIKVLEKFYNEVKTRFPSYLVKLWFQQDGASPHTAHITRNWLKKTSKKRVVSKHFPIEWAPHSPDLSPPDFFFGAI